MECSQEIFPDNKTFLDQFTRKTMQNHIPFSGSIEITRRCNLKCVHCYLGDRNGEWNSASSELTAQQWFRLMDQFTGEGCLYLLITGGEPLIRKDFADIYSYSRSKGLIVVIFSNGTLISDDHIALFKDIPPRFIDISIYGATEATYEKITGVKGSFALLLKNIDKLLENNIAVRFKTVVLSYNFHEFDAIEKMIKNWGGKLRYDPSIFPRFNGDPLPISLRVSAKAIVDKEFSAQERAEDWARVYRQNWEHFEQAPPSSRLYVCGAGVNLFHIDHRGGLHPCLMIENMTYQITDNNFSSEWNRIVKQMNEQTINADSVCYGCDKKLFCDYCPAFFELENGNERTRSEYLCELGEHRFNAVNAIV